MTIRVLCSVVAAATLATPALAQGPGGYPDKTVRFVVPFAAAGPIDVISRLYAQKLAERWKKPVIVENRPGATGTIGTDLVVKAPPDGYTLLFAVDLPIVMAPALFKPPYDSTKDLMPIAAVADGMNLLAVHPSAGAKTLAELVAAGKSKPGALTYSSAGNASPGHMCIEALTAASGAQFTHVPYKGAAPAGQAVLAGEVQMFCGPIPVNLPHVRSGKLRAMGVTGPAASPLAPDIAPLSATYPSVVLTNWYALFAPPRTPAAIADFLRAELKAVSNEPDVRTRISGIGLDPRWIESAELASMIRTDIAKWTKLVRDANIKAD